MLIILFFLPLTSQTLRELKVLAANKAEMLCSVDFSVNQQTSIIWMSPSQTSISLNENIQGNKDKYDIIKSGENDYTLVIKRVKEEDEGAYECHVMQGPSKLSFTRVNLVVMVPPKLLTPSHLEKEIKEGEDILMFCKASGKPEPIYLWKRIYPDRQELVSSNKTLKISNCSMEMTGKYECIADNEVPPFAKSTFFLKVHGKPKVKFPYRRILQQNNKELMIQCLVTWYPRNQTFWKFKNKIISFDKEELSEKLESYDMDRKFLNSARGKQKIKIGKDEDENEENNNNNNNYIINNNNNNNLKKYSLISHEISSFFTSVSLVIKNFQVSDQGIYKCEAENQFGSDEAEVEIINTFDDNRKGSTEELTVVEGGHVSMRCEIKGKEEQETKKKEDKKEEDEEEEENKKKKDGGKKETKGQIGWMRKTWSIKKYEVLDFSKKKKFKFSDENKILEIKKVESFDSGLYKCFNENNPNKTINLFYLSVTVTSASSNNPSTPSVPLTIFLATCLSLLLLLFFFIFLLFCLMKKIKNLHNLSNDSSKEVLKNFSHL